MNFNYRGFGGFARLISVFVLFLLVYSSGILVVSAQKKPKSLKLDVDMDDSQLCSARGKVNLNGTRFCSLYWSYNTNFKRKDFEAAQANRNEMIDIVRGQVDTFYKLRKDGRRTKIRWYQSVLDFLQIGGNLAATIMNGDRAIKIVNESLTALASGRTDYDKNFEVLQTQSLINTMNKNRAEIMTEIYNKRDKPVRANKPSEAYTWYEAKNDLRRYLLAGTFDNALDQLVTDTGEAAKKAEKKLAAITQENVDEAEKANVSLTNLKKALAGTAPQKAAATKILRKVVSSLMDIDEIKGRLEDADITDKSEGADILKALIKIRRDFAVEDRDDLVITINTEINEAGGELE